MQTNRIIPARGTAWWCVAAGFWLLFSPLILGFANWSVATWTTVAFGVVIAAVSMICTSTEQNGPVWWNVGIAILLIIAPWVVGYNELARAATDNVLTGVFVASFSLMTAVSRQSQVWADRIS